MSEQDNPLKPYAWALTHASGVQILSRMFDGNRERWAAIEPLYRVKLADLCNHLARVAVIANDDWHRQYDDYDGYQGSALQMLNAEAMAVVPKPINMILFCPSCGTQHIDGVERHPGGEIFWSNPPHRSHKCADCGTIWRPCDLPTNGVQFIETKGKADTWSIVLHISNPPGSEVAAHHSHRRPEPASFVPHPLFVSVDLDVETAGRIKLTMSEKVSNLVISHDAKARVIDVDQLAVMCNECGRFQTLESANAFKIGENDNDGADLVITHLICQQSAEGIYLVDNTGNVLEPRS